MKRKDQGRASLVDFLRSIKFAPQQGVDNRGGDFEAPFAQLEQRVRTRLPFSAEESQLIRSAN